MIIHDFWRLQEVLINFANNPNEIWGEPDDGNGNFIDIQFKQICQNSSSNQSEVSELIYLQCGKVSRLIKTKENLECFNCSLNDLCLMLLNRYIRTYWCRDGWRLEGFGNVNKMTFQWSDCNFGNNTYHQSLVVYRTDEGIINHLIFLTFASATNCYYKVIFDLEANLIKLAYLDNISGWIEIKYLDGIVLDFIVSMMPSWMLYTHYPR